MRFTNFGLAVFTTLCLKAAPAAGAGLALVLAIDVSASVTADSYVLQRNGIARAFENLRLVDAISAVPGGIEVLVLEWSDPERIKVTVGWQRVGDPDSAAAFAGAVRRTERSSNGLTAIGPALLAAAAAFDTLPEPVGRRIIDISGDGMANFGLPPMAARDRIVAAGISINGLAILTEEAWLEGYYRSNVIGGPGAFVVAAQDFGSFADAMLKKLVQEVAGSAPTTLGYRTKGPRAIPTVIPGCLEGAGPEPMNTGLSAVSQVGVHSFRARGLRPRPGMTSVFMLSNILRCNKSASARSR
jgi:hypothetical protein